MQGGVGYSVYRARHGRAVVYGTFLEKGVSACTSTIDIGPDLSVPSGIQRN